MSPLDFLRFMEEYDKYQNGKNKPEEKKKDDEHKPHKFTLLESVGLCMMFGPIIGFTYLYFFKFVLLQLETIIK